MSKITPKVLNDAVADLDSMIPNDLDDDDLLGYFSVLFPDVPRETIDYLNERMCAALDRSADEEMGTEEALASTWLQCFLLGLHVGRTHPG